MPFVLTLACPLFPAPPTARPLIPTDPLRPTTCNARTYLQPQLNKAIRRDESLSKADKNLKDWIVFRYAPLYPPCLFNPLLLSPYLSLVLSLSLAPSLPSSPFPDFLPSSLSPLLPYVFLLPLLFLLAYASRPSSFRARLLSALTFAFTETDVDFPTSLPPSTLLPQTHTQTLTTTHTHLQGGHGRGNGSDDVQRHEP